MIRHCKQTVMEIYIPLPFQAMTAEPHSSVGSVADLRTGGRWFDLRLGQYFFRGLMKVIATGFILLSPLSIVSTMVMWESSQWLGKKLCGVLLKRTPGKHGKVHWLPRYYWNTVENGVKHHTIGKTLHGPCYTQVKAMKMMANIQWTLSQTSPGFYVSAVQVFRKHCGKRRNCS